jgi:hypothetical protein
MEIPDFVFEIPDDAAPEVKLYMRAQVVIQAAFHAFGDREYLPRAATLTTDDLKDVLAFALAMLVAADASAKTNRDIRTNTDTIARYMRQMATSMREGGDDNPKRLLEVLGMLSTPVN